MPQTSKLMRGAKNIHFAPFKNESFAEPVKIEFAKKVECKFNYESSQEWADDRIIDSDYTYNGGEGVATVLGLTAEEQVLLFGNKKAKGGVSVNSGDTSPEGAFLFERGKKGGARRLYVVYACQCSPVDITATSIEDGKKETDPVEINFTIGEFDDGLVYFYIDSDASDVDQTQISEWFSEVQMPKPASE